MAEEQKKYSVSTIIITVLAVIIILVLAFLFFYYSTTPAPIVLQQVSAPVVKKEPPVSQIVPTDIIKFAPPETLPTIQKNGKCFASSVAQPFRQDAFRCMVGNSIYDPCFETTQKGAVFCQMSPFSSDSFLIKLTQALPKASVPQTAQDNWAWFLTLKDGTQCSPFTGTRPFFGTGPDAKVAYYGCKSNDKTQQIVLLGDLTQGTVWTAAEAILTKPGGVPSGSWTIQSTQQVEVDTVWQ